MQNLLLVIAAIVGLLIPIIGFIVFMATLAGIAWIPELAEKLWDKLRGR
jgi:hypothetical protein